MNDAKRAVIGSIFLGLATLMAGCVVRNPQ